jgi:diadenosine tetraphosphatase ApaH/serine/threonine PP2A family protein phosphatase
MQIAILSDIHGNIEAFRSVLGDIGIRRPPVGEIISLGDTLGYGPEPEACINLLRENGILSVQGNHELGLARPEYRRWFNPQSRQALDRTGELISADTLAYIRELPPFLSRHGCLFVHGLPPASAFTYLFEIPLDEMSRIFAGFTEAVAFMGHTHELEIVSWHAGQASREVLAEGSIDLDRSRRYLVNIGAVGQPRDGDNRAKYVLWDTDAWKLTVRFVAYDIQAAMAGFKRAGMPELYARRLL